MLAERRRQREYAAVPTSPGLKRQRLSSEGAVVRRWRRLVWWIEGDVGGGWGVRGRWIAGGVWGGWLLFLSVHRTGDGRFEFFLVLFSFCSAPVRGIQHFLSDPQWWLSLLSGSLPPFNTIYFGILNLIGAISSILYF